MIRTHAAGRLRVADAGAEVTLAGWVARRRDHGGVTFLDLRDASGVVQVVLRDALVEADAARALRAEFCVLVRGAVTSRPAGNANPELPTGEVEVVASSLEVLSTAAELPFPVEGSTYGPGSVDEIARWRYRYLDLRRAWPAHALRTRARMTSIIRRVMESYDFLDVETPYLTRSTPEGARDFLVPVRLQPGHWYALPQSPQLFKQLLMVAGLERYYQIARCFRDEDFRADRTAEFTQLDVEMSFLDEEDIYTLTEDLLTTVWREILGVQLPRPFERLTHAEAVRRFGSDRPDLRFGLELVDLTSYLAGSTFRVFAGQPYVGGVVFPGGGSLTRRELDGWADWARGRGARGLAYVLIGDDGAVRESGPVANNLSASELAGLPAAAGASAGDAVFLAAGLPQASQELLGALRLAIGRDRSLIDESLWRFLWVTDFPMFQATADGGWTAEHHPFTGPTPEWADRFAADPGSALARAYDVVANGIELGGGSIRIHQAAMQQQVFDTIGLTPEEAQTKFGFLLEAFRYGPPPHGGIAFGLDRLAAVLAGTDAIREVMAFPKASSGGDPLTGAPTPITAEQRREAGIDVDPGGPPPLAPRLAPAPSRADHARSELKSGGMTSERA
jgi:aspartyl-tRNA synthetase